MSRLQRFSPAFSLAALVVAIGTAAATSFGPPVGWSQIVGSGQQATSPLATNDLTRVMFPVQVKPDSPHSNNMISLTHNWGWAEGSGWRRDEPDSPSVALTLESFYYGLAELNFDMRPPGDRDPWPGGRAMGFAARYDGTYSTLTIGGRPYNAGSAGVKLTGGTGPEPTVAIFEGEGADRGESLRVQRADGSASVRLLGGESPALSFGMSGHAAAHLGEGVLRIAGDAGAAPLINIAGAGAETTVLSVRGPDLEAPAQFAVSAAGRLDWGDGLAAADVSLARTGPGRIETGGELAVASLRIGGGAALQSVRLHHVELNPAQLAAQRSRDETIELRGVANSSLAFVNGPEQPAGIAIAGVRVAGEGRLVVRFINMSADAAQPASGVYALLIVEPTAGE